MKVTARQDREPIVKEDESCLAGSGTLSTFPSLSCLLGSGSSSSFARAMFSLPLPRARLLRRWKQTSGHSLPLREKLPDVCYLLHRPGILIFSLLTRPGLISSLEALRADHGFILLKDLLPDKKLVFVLADRKELDSSLVCPASTNWELICYLRVSLLSVFWCLISILFHLPLAHSIIMSRKGSVGQGGKGKVPEKTSSPPAEKENNVVGVAVERMMSSSQALAHGSTG